MKSVRGMPKYVNNMSNSASQKSLNASVNYENYISSGFNKTAEMVNSTPRYPPPEIVPMLHKIDRANASGGLPQGTLTG